MATTERAEKIQSINPQYEKKERWDKPQPLELKCLPNFPIETIPSPFRQYVEAVAANLQVYEDFPAITCLGVISTALQGKVDILEQKSDHRQPLNTYTLLVADSGERKTPVWSKMKRILEEYEKEFNQNNKSIIAEQSIRLEIAQKSQKEAIAKKDFAEAARYQEEITKLEEGAIKPLRLLADDITLESLANKLYENNEKLSIIEDEGGLFDIIAGQYSNKKSTNINTILKAHDGGGIRIDRKNGETIHVEKALLTLCIATQYKVLKGLFENDQFTGRGFVQRFLFSKPRSMLGWRAPDGKPMSQKAEDDYNIAVRKLLELADSLTLTLSDKAKEEYVKFNREIEPKLIEELASIVGWASKLEGKTLRIAGLLHSMKFHERLPDNTIVSGQTMKNAITIAKYFLEHAKWAYRTMGAADDNVYDARYVLDKIKKHDFREGKGCELLRRCRRFKDIEELTRIMEFLEQTGYCRWDEPHWSGDRRKPERVYRFSPFIFEPHCWIEHLEWDGDRAIV